MSGAVTAWWRRLARGKQGGDLASRLTRRVTLQEAVRTADGGGGYTTSWQDIAYLWAEVAPLSGQEVYRHHREEAHLTHRITIRYRDNVRTGMRFVLDGRVLIIRAIANPGERNELFEIYAEEGV